MNVVFFPSSWAIWFRKNWKMQWNFWPQHCPDKEPSSKNLGQSIMSILPKRQLEFKVRHNSNTWQQSWKKILWPFLWATESQRWICIQSYHWQTCPQIQPRSRIWRRVRTILNDKEVKAEQKVVEKIEAEWSKAQRDVKSSKLLPKNSKADKLAEEIKSFFLCAWIMDERSSIKPKLSRWGNSWSIPAKTCLWYQTISHNCQERQNQRFQLLNREIVEAVCGQVFKQA